MPNSRKLGRTTSQRKALLRGLVTAVIEHEKIETTEAKAKDVKALVDSIVALAIKEKDNFTVVEKKVSRAKLDKNGKKVTEKAKSKNGNEYNKVVREVSMEKVQSDNPSRLNARRKMINMMQKIHDSNGKTIDLTKKLFDEIAPKYVGRVGGYTRIIKVGPRKGDCAEMVILELI